MYFCASAALYVRGDSAVVTDVPQCPYPAIEPLWNAHLPTARALFAASRAAVRKLSPAELTERDAVVRDIDTHDALCRADHHCLMAELEFEQSARMNAEHESGGLTNPSGPLELVLDGAQQGVLHAQDALTSGLMRFRDVVLQRVATSAHWHARMTLAHTPLLGRTFDAAKARAAFLATADATAKEELRNRRDACHYLDAHSNFAYAQLLRLIARPTRTGAANNAVPPAQDVRALWLAREQLLDANEPNPQPDPLEQDEAAAAQAVATWARVHKQYGVTQPDTLPLLTSGSAVGAAVFDDTTWRDVVAVRGGAVSDAVTQTLLNPHDMTGAQWVGDAAPQKWKDGAAEGVRAFLYRAWADVRDGCSSAFVSQHHNRDVAEWIDAVVSAVTAVHAAAKAKAPASALPFSMAAPQHVRADLLLCHAAGILGAADALNGAAPTVIPAPPPTLAVPDLLPAHAARAVQLLDSVERELLPAVAPTAQPMYRARIAALRTAAALP